MAVFVIKMQFHFSLKAPCSLTRHNGLLAVETLGWVLIRVAFGTQQDLILGGKWFLYQRAIAFGTPEAPLVPVAAFVGQILGENKPMLMNTLLHSVFVPQLLPEIKWKAESTAMVPWRDDACIQLRDDASTRCHGVGLFCRSLPQGIRSCFGTGNCPSLWIIRDMFLLE